MAPFQIFALALAFKDPQLSFFQRDTLISVQLSSGIALVLRLSLVLRLPLVLSLAWKQFK